jgi:hypothetical protein
LPKILLKGKFFCEKALAVVSSSTFHPLAAIPDDRSAKSAAAASPLFSSSRQRCNTYMVGNVIAQRQPGVARSVESQEWIL